MIQNSLKITMNFKTVSNICFINILFLYRGNTVEKLLLYCCFTLSVCIYVKKGATVSTIYSNYSTENNNKSIFE